MRIIRAAALVSAVVLCSSSYALADCGPHRNITDLGYEGTRAEVDFDGDGCADFCRVVGDPGTYRLWCTSSNGANAGKTFDSGPGIDPGWPSGRQWIDVDGNNKADYCRVVGDPGNTRLRCTLSAGTSFRREATSGVIDIGYHERERWIQDGNNDGRREFCRVVGNVGYTSYACSELKIESETIYLVETRMSPDPHQAAVEAECYCHVFDSDLKLGTTCGKPRCIQNCWNTYKDGGGFRYAWCRGGTKGCENQCLR
jgi:hypothetical protein